MNKITTARKLYYLPIAIALCTVSSGALAFPGGNNNFFASNNNGCGTDWPAWTPMYWMEEMADMMRNNNNNCYPNQAYGAYPPTGYNPYAAAITPQARQYQAQVAAAYRNPYQAAYTQRALLPYALAQGRAPRQLAYPWSGMTSRNAGFPFSSAMGGQQGRFSQLFGGRRNTSFMPFSRGFGSSNPFTSMSPMGSFGSPFGGGMSPMSGMGMSPMGMGLPGMSPMSGMGMSPMGGGFSPFGGSPFGGSSFMPKF